MKTMMKWLVPAVLALAPLATAAQSADAAYCNDLATMYERYLDQSSKRGQQPQSLDSKVGFEKCKAGDVSGIPALEKALKSAGYTLPARG